MVCQIGGLLLMKNKLYKYKDTIVRVLKESDQSVFIIDCLKTKMPYTVHKMDFKDAILCDEDLLMQETNEPVFDISEASERNKKIAYERYNMIAPLLSFMAAFFYSNGISLSNSSGMFINPSSFEVGGNCNVCWS